MIHLHFSQALIQFLADHRSTPLTEFFLLMSFLGDVYGYILIVTLVYVMFDKTQGVRLSILVLLAMCLNHVLKIIIKNPRPFIREGTYLRKWAISPDAARELATEYSTPSGHAMAGGAFYSYVYLYVQNRYVRPAAIAMLVLTGLSRPYLGVHYLEDIISGWPIGILVGVIAVNQADSIADRWSRLSYRSQILVAVGFSLILWVVTVAINGWRIDGQPRAFLGYAGFLTGIVIGEPLELARVNFDPRSSGLTAKLTRYLLSLALVIGTVELLGLAAHKTAGDFSIAGYLFQYVRYTAAGLVNIFVAPLIFTAIGLASRAERGAESWAS